MLILKAIFMMKELFTPRKEYNKKCSDPNWNQLHFNNSFQWITSKMNFTSAYIKVLHVVYIPKYIIKVNWEETSLKYSYMFEDNQHNITSFKIKIFRQVKWAIKGKLYRKLSVDKFSYFIFSLRFVWRTQHFIWCKVGN